jgi:hypothetical protein
MIYNKFFSSQPCVSGFPAAIQPSQPGLLWLILLIEAEACSAEVAPAATAGSLPHEKQLCGTGRMAQLT